jgi:hypothetical protein
MYDVTAEIEIGNMDGCEEMWKCDVKGKNLQRVETHYSAICKHHMGYLYTVRRSPAGPELLPLGKVVHNVCT